MVVERRIDSIKDVQVAHKELVDYIRERDDTFPPFGRILKDKEIASTADTKLRHGMGSKYNGYLVIRCDTNCTFKEVVSDNPAEDITLRASSGTPTITLWVF